MTTDPKSLPEDVMRRAVEAMASAIGQQMILRTSPTEIAEHALAAALPVFLEWHEAEKFEWRASASRIMDHVVRDSANGIADAIKAEADREAGGDGEDCYWEGVTYGKFRAADIARLRPDREALNPSPDAPASTQRAQEPESVSVDAETSELISGPRTLPLDVVLDQFKDGDEVGWAAEFAWLRENHRARLNELKASIAVHGITEPISLGPDGRIWDGHHRLCVAEELGLEFVPVKRGDG